MSSEDFHSLVVGDIVRHKNGSSSFVVTGHFGNRVIAVRTVDMTNPEEWVLVFKANAERMEE